MWVCTGQPSAQFTLLSWLSSAGRATNRQGGCPLGFHSCIMHLRSRARWSIVINAYSLGSKFSRVSEKTLASFLIGTRDRIMGRGWKANHCKRHRCSVEKSTSLQHSADAIPDGFSNAVPGKKERVEEY